MIKFVENSKDNLGSTQGRTAQRSETIVRNAIDFLVMKKDYHSLQEISFADALQGDDESLTSLLVKCRSVADIPLTVIYDEIVSKTIDQIKNLGQEGNLDPEHQEYAINTILEGFLHLSHIPESQSLG